jgi:alanyl-tRNA synthetase
MQFNRDKDGHLHPLPKPSVDTGMGLERIAAVVQGVHNNYDTDDFQQLIRAIADLVKGVDMNHPSLKVIADHIRACCFLIVDGVIPSNEGRGYVLRRIIRRAVRHGHQLGLPTPFLCHLVAPLITVMGDPYHELVIKKAEIEHVLSQEEHQFARTLEQGLRLLQEQIKGLSGKDIPGDVAFKLYDTYGFPLDLTADIAREHHVAVDMQGFHQCMQQQREQSLSASQFHVDYSQQNLLNVVSIFHGYEQEVLSSHVVAMLCEGTNVSQLKAGVKAAIILADTPFYAESGGQVGDRGELVSDQGVFRVDDTQKIGQAIVHYGELSHGEWSQGQLVHARVDSQRRQSIRLNHTATHLLHAALKVIVGERVHQKGSLVEAERARFDFSYAEPLTQIQIEQIERLVNDRIRANDEVITDVMSMDAAKQSGAMALFGEKYSDMVRVLSVGDFSKELCGGTHVRQTGDIGLFKITAEYGVASGVRRIEMVTGHHALQWVQGELGRLSDAALLLKTSPSSILDKLTQMLQEVKRQEKILENLTLQLATQESRALLSEVQQRGDLHLLVKRLDHLDAQGLRTLLDQLKSCLDEAVIVLVAVADKKMSVMAFVSKSVLSRVPTAVFLVKHLCGKGGGREDMAQGGGPVPDDLDKKMAAIADLVFEGVLKK